MDRILTSSERKDEVIISKAFVEQQVEKHPTVSRATVEDIVEQTATATVSDVQTVFEKIKKLRDPGKG